jgi:hypothetical protein
MSHTKQYVQFLAEVERRIRTYGTLECCFAYLYDAEYRLSMVEMPGLNSAAQRLAIQRLVADSGSVFVLHATEAWYCDLQPGDAGYEESVRLYWIGRLQEHPAVKEKVRVQWESLTEDIVVVDADILRPPGESARLGPFVDAKIILPYPGFKRYFKRSLTTQSRASDNVGGRTPS